MLTLHEVEEHLYGLMCRSYEVRRDEALHVETEATSEARKRRDEHWRALIHAYDAMAAQAKDLETALHIERTTAANRLDLLKAKDERIAELERERAKWAKIDATPLEGRLFESETLDKALTKIIAMEDASIAQRERIAELEAVLEVFVGHYPSMVNPDLDTAWNAARAALEHK